MSHESGEGGDRHVSETAPLQLLRSAMPTRAGDIPWPGGPFALEFARRQGMESQHGPKEGNNDCVTWDWETNFSLDDAFYESQLESQASAAQAGQNPSSCTQSLPSRWVEYQTPKTRHGQWSFYHSSTLGWSTWQRPDGPIEVARDIQRAGGGVGHGAQVEWEEHAYYGGHRKRWRYYYHNAPSASSTWWRPTSPYIPCFEKMRCPFPARWPPWR